MLEVSNLTESQIFGETAISACVDVQEEIRREEVVKSEGVSKCCLVFLRHF